MTNHTVVMRVMQLLQLLTAHDILLAAIIIYNRPTIWSLHYIWLIMHTITYAKRVMQSPLFILVFVRLFVNRISLREKF